MSISRREHYNKLSFIVDIILLFLFIFNIEMPVIKNTSILIYLICFLLFFYSPKKILSNLRVVCRTKFFLNCLGLIVLLIVFIFFVTTFLAAYDFSLIPTLINLCINLCVVIFLCAYFNTKGYTLVEFLKLLIFTFLVQSMIEIIALLSPAVLSFVQSFHNDEFTIMKLEEYGARKGLALSGSVFFALAITFGYSLMLYFYYLILKNSIKIYDVLIGILLIIGAILSGRTGTIGLLVGLFYFVIATRMERVQTISFWKYFKKTVLILIILLVFASLIFPDKVLSNLLEVSYYFFEFLYAYSNTGSFNISSTDTMSEMYFLPDFYTLLFGDGYYSSPDGLGYYMETDIGYMRNILLFGIIGLILVLCIEYFFLFGRKISKQERLFFNFTLFFFIIIHGKGEVFVYSIMLHKVLFLVIFYTFLVSLKTKKINLL